MAAVVAAGVLAVTVLALRRAEDGLRKHYRMINHHRAAHAKVLLAETRASRAILDVGLTPRASRAGFQPAKH